MKMVDNLEDQLLEEKARLMAMLEYLSRTDLESDPRHQLGFLALNNSRSLGQASPGPLDDDAGEEVPAFSRKSSDMGISDFFRS